MKIFLTGISATPYAREYTSSAAQTLRERGHEVFVPHEGGWQAPEKPFETDRFDFEATYQALSEADLLIAVLDGYTVDDCVAVQLGIFYALSRASGRPRRIMGILNDTRIAGREFRGADRGLSAQIRMLVRDAGAVYPDFKRVLAEFDGEEA